MLKMKSVAKLLRFSCFLLFLLESNNCFAFYQKQMTIESVEQAKQQLKDYQGEPSHFQLLVPLDKPLTLGGKVVSREVAMAIITDQVLEKGWMPNGFVDKENVRYYHYSY